MATFTAIEAGSRYRIVDQDGALVTWEGEIIEVSKSDAVEMSARMTAGVDVSAFYVDEGDYYYGCPDHQAFGDSWFYADCQGAW